MKFDESIIDEILKNKIEEFGNNSKRLFVANNDKLLIILSTHNQRNSLFAVRSFLRGFNTSLLFLSDFNNSYYLENNEDIKKTSYYKEIKKNIEIYGAKNVTLFGSSMAGYAAIKYATLFNANVIATNPQVDLSVSYPFAWQELRKTFDRIKYFSPINTTSYKGKALVFFGYHPLDCVNYDCFIKKLQKNKISFSTIRLSTDKHDFPFSENPNIIFDLLNINLTLLPGGDND